MRAVKHLKRMQVWSKSLTLWRNQRDNDGGVTLQFRRRSNDWLIIANSHQRTPIKGRVRGLQMERPPEGRPFEFREYLDAQAGVLAQNSSNARISSPAICWAVACSMTNLCMR